MNTEVSKLLNKGVIEQCAHHIEAEFISNVFLKEKRDASYRMILNLKSLNKNVAYHKFKMDTLEFVLLLVKPNCYMASVDLRDVYYTVPIAVEHRKYLRFYWNDQMYQFACLPNGLASAPRIFTKLLKPIFAHLRLQGHTLVGYIDDTYLQADTYNCLANIKATVNLFTKCGFIIHQEKSVLKPSKQINFLGFVIDSTIMTVTMTNEKNSKMKKTFQAILLKKKITGAEFGPLHYRTLEIDRPLSLNAAKAILKH